MNGLTFRLLFLTAVTVLLALGLSPVNANHEDTVRIVATLRAHPDSPYPDAAGTAVFNQVSGGWDFSVTLQGFPDEQFIVSYFQQNPPPINETLNLCTITTDAAGDGWCSGHVADLPEPDSIAVGFLDKEGIPMGASRDDGDFTFVSDCGSPRSPGEVAIIGHTNASSGTVVVPELDLTSSISGGCFELRNLSLPQDPILITFEITADGFRPTTWLHYIVWGGTSGGPDITLNLEAGTEPQVFDPCPALLANPQDQSAALAQHAALCAELIDEDANFPATGSGNELESPRALVASVLFLVVGGFLSIAVGAAISRGVTRTR